MEQRLHVIPILAVVADGNNDVAGILMPFGGPSLESLSESASDISSAASAVSGSTDLGITSRQLRDLARGVCELAEVGVVHGDINDRNTLLTPLDPKASISTATAHNEQKQTRLVLIDFGEVAPEYHNDAFALGELLIWCMDRCSRWDGEERRMVERAAGVLKGRGNFEKALCGLESG